MSDTRATLGATRRELAYSLQWAESVLRSLYRKHARAPEFIHEILGLSDRQMAVLLASNDPAWEILRNLAKTWDNWHAKQEQLGLPVRPENWARTLLLQGVSLGYLSLREYLTARISDLELKSGTIRTGG